MELALFDFDGTLTKKDSLQSFLIFLKGWPKFLLGIIILLPTVFKWKIGLTNAQLAKEKLYHYFLKGLSSDYLERRGEAFLPTMERMIKLGGLKKMKWHSTQGHQVVVVTASSSEWVSPWCKKNNIELICTHLEYKHGLATGNILGMNCSGIEKVNRIKSKFDLSTFNKIYAYGNSKDDIPMLSLAHEKFYKCFG